MEKLDFEDLVILDLKGRLIDEEREIVRDITAEEFAVLSGDYNQWLAELNALKRDVEIQLAAQRAKLTNKRVECIESHTHLEWLKFKGAEEQNRVRSLRFLASIESKIHDIKRMKVEATHLGISSS